MKKFYLIVFCFLVSCNCVYAGVTEGLYETPTDNKTTSATIQTFLTKNHYQFAIPSSTEGKTNFYINNSTSTPSEYVFIIVSATAQKTRIYFLSNGQQFKIKDTDLKLKKLNNKTVMEAFHEEALVAKNNYTKKDVPKPQAVTYDFSDEAQEKYNADKKAQNATPVKIVSPQVEKTKNKKTFVSSQVQPVNTPPVPVSKSNSTATKTLKGTISCIPAGSVLDAALQSTIDSASLQKDDKVTATLSSDFLYKGILIAPKGSIIYGKATQVIHPGYAYGNGELNLNFYQILTPKGSQINMTTSKITLNAESKRTVNIAKNILVGTGLGVLGGLLYGDASYIAKGAIIGATSGGVYAVGHKGVNVSIPPGKPLQIKLIQPINISVYD